MTTRSGPVGAVAFDIGETVVDKSREYAGLARALGTTPHTFSAVFGAAVAAGRGVDAAVAHFDPHGLARYPELLASGVVPAPAEQDLFPGARATLRRLRDAGLRVAVVGNQPPGYGEALRALDLPADVVATSSDWGVRKPDPAFFARVVAELLGPGVRPASVVYVGDQPGADVVGAVRAGLRAIRVRQGPWGALVRDPAADARCVAVVDRVADVAEVLLGR